MQVLEREQPKFADIEMANLSPQPGATPLSSPYVAPETVLGRRPTPEKDDHGTIQTLNRDLEPPIKKKPPLVCYLETLRAVSDSLAQLEATVISDSKRHTW